MALPIRDFRSKIDGLSATDYVKQLDYNLKTNRERLAKVKDILKYPLFFEKYFSKYHKVNLSKEDFLSGDKNICKSLEKFADYLLLSNDIEDNLKDSTKEWKTEYKFYTDEKLGKKIAKDYERKVETIMFLKDKNKNYRKQIKQDVYDSDYKDQSFDSEIKIYNINSPCNFIIQKVNNLAKYQELTLSLKSLIEKINNGKYLIQPGEEPLYKIKKFLKENLKYNKKEQILFKDKIKGTIYYNHCLPESEKIQWDLINFTDTNQIQALLKIRGSSLLTDLGILVHDLNQLIANSDLSDFELEVIELWRRNDYTQEIIAEILGVSQQFISATLKSISEKLVKQYKTQYEDWLNLNYIRGTYKKCSKCQQVKLISKFGKNSNNKDGLYSCCKTCRKE